MSIEYKSGCLLDAFDRGDVNVIGHVVNCQGVMGSGIAKSIRERYPLVYKEYLELNKGHKSNPSDLLGEGQGVWLSYGTGVFNLHAQLDFGYSKRQLNYGAFAVSLGEMVTELSKDDVVGFPYLMGCDRAGGDWDIVSEMIEHYLKNHDVKIYKLEVSR